MWAKRWETDLAGTQPAGYVHLLAVTVTNEADINIALEEKLLLFRQVRDEMRVQVLSYLKTMSINVELITSQ